MSLEESQTRHRSAGRNDPCPCGSGKKYKKCHYAADEAAIHDDLQKQRSAAEAAAEAMEQAEDGKTAKKAAAAVQKSKGATANSRGGPKGRSAAGQPSNLPRRGAV